MSATTKHLIVVCGPTASGKTSLSIALAGYFNTEIISFDARQFYAGMSIGTAKPGEAELNLVKHHFIGHKQITETYASGQFARDADLKASELFTHYDVVVAVGGSGQYMDAWLYGLNEFPPVPDDIKTYVNDIYVHEGLEGLQQHLLAKDPVYYAIVDLKNPRRLTRALEVCFSSQKPYSAYLNRPDKTHKFQITLIGIDLPRALLYKRINQRVEHMIASGLEQEVKSLLEYRHTQALQTIGYSEWFEYYDGQRTIEETVQAIQQHSRNYAKRQLTWFRRYENVLWSDSTELNTIKKLLPV